MSRGRAALATAGVFGVFAGLAVLAELRPAWLLVLVVTSLLALLVWGVYTAFREGEP